MHVIITIFYIEFYQFHEGSESLNREWSFVCRRGYKVMASGRSLDHSIELLRQLSKQSSDGGDM